VQSFLRTALVIPSFFVLLLFSSSVLAAELAGQWTLTIDTPRGVQHPTLVIVRNGDGYSGVYNSLRGPIDIETIQREGNKFAFPLVITVPIGEIEVNYRGSIDKDDMAGSVQNPRGEVQFTGKRTGP
jgi:hypothetical protein